MRRRKAMQRNTGMTLFARSYAFLLVTAYAALTLSGCKSAPPPLTDAQLQQNVTSAIHSDQAIAQQPVNVAVQQGVVTLSGNVSDDTARDVAAQDAAKVAGVKEVVNDVAVSGVAVTPTVTSPSAPNNPRPVTREERQQLATRKTLPPPPNNAVAPPPPQPVIQTVTAPSGKAIPVRITESLSSATSQAGETFTGVVTRPVVSDGFVLIPAGSAVSGRVVAAKDATHFKGSSLLSIQLTSVRRHGTAIPISTTAYSVQGTARGKNSAIKIGGGAAAGALLGGLLGGGKGAAIGTLAGGGAGTAYQGLTRGQQVSIPSESVVTFRLAAPFSVKTSQKAADTDAETNPDYTAPDTTAAPTLHPRTPDQPQ